MSLDYDSLITISLRLGLALLLSALLGWEREAKGKPAGLRTHMMVSLGAAAAVVATFELINSPQIHPHFIRLDPSRVIQGVVGGIGFLGAGTIIQSRGSVEGITTAASIWVTGMIGLICGLGSYSVAIITALMAWGVLRIVGLLGRWMFKTRPR